MALFQPVGNRGWIPANHRAWGRAGGDVVMVLSFLPWQFTSINLGGGGASEGATKGRCVFVMMLQISKYQIFLQNP